MIFYQQGCRLPVSGNGDEECIAAVMSGGCRLIGQQCHSTRTPDLVRTRTSSNTYQEGDEKDDQDQTHRRLSHAPK